MPSTYGVKRVSILNQSRFFHVVDGLDLDVMHDQLEGALHKKYIKVEEYIALGTLNERIRTFDYGPSDISNNSRPIKEQALTNNSASLSRSGTKQYHCSKVSVYTCRSAWCFTHWYTNFL